ncbi:MAG: glycosyltransferase family 39 protein [Chloroflexi bacterium]|nr:glycosyltransferase family 39 protein [Chloroflexota bacterium]
MRSARRSAYGLTTLLAIIWLGTWLRVWQLGQIPPGLNYDEAKYGTDAISIMQGQGFPGFPANFGREPLFSYVTAGAFMLFGVSPWAVRLVSAAAGIITIPAVYILAARIFQDQPGRRREVLALLAAFMLAVLPWHFGVSRMAFRAILVPLFGTLAFYCLWRGLQLRQRRWLIVSGIFVGTSLHTYQAARLVPFLIIIALVLYALRYRLKFAWLVRRTVLIGLVALIVFAPLGYYFLTHPGAFLERAMQANVAQQAEGSGEKAAIIARNSLAVLGMFTFWGDEDSRFNTYGRPVLDPILSLLFAGGLIVSGRRFRQPEYAFVLIWLIVMLIPSMLANFAPSFKRTVGSIPPTVFMIVLGLDGAWQIAARLVSRARPAFRPAGRVLSAVILIVASVVSLGLNWYFVEWGQASNLYTAFDTGTVTTGRYVQALPPDERIYLSPIAADYPGFVVGSTGRTGIRSFDGRRCTVLPDRATTHTTYVLLAAEPERRDRRSEGVLSAIYPSLTLAAQDADRDLPYFRAFGLPAGAAPRLDASQSISATFGEAIDLLGYHPGSTPWQVGSTVTLTTYWRARQTMPFNYVLFVHVTPVDDLAGSPRFQDDRQPCEGSYPTTVWTTDEIIGEFRKLEVPADLKPGEYELSVGWYLLPDLTHLPVTRGPGHVGQNRLPLGRIQIEQL